MIGFTCRTPSTARDWVTKVAVDPAEFRAKRELIGSREAVAVAYGITSKTIYTIEKTGLISLQTAWKLRAAGFPLTIETERKK